MWIVVAEEEMTCVECLHDIPAGTKCLSQMPMDMPENFRRRKYENLCIDCDKCSRKKAQASCYVRQLSHWYTSKKETEQHSTCGYCGAPIPKDTRAVAQKIYVWPESEADLRSTTGSDDGKSALAGVGATVAGVAAKVGLSKSDTGDWQNLSPETRRKFQTLGRGLKPLTPKMGKRVYEKEVPNSIRKQGEAAVRRYRKSRHLSHIKSVSNARGQARWPSNMLLEDPGENRKRGRRNMSPSDEADVRRKARAAGTHATVRKGLIIAAIAVGVGIVGVTAYHIVKASRHDLPLDEYYVYFCKDGPCKTKFAQAVTNAARA